jgi:hypothetical protein
MRKASLAAAKNDKEKIQLVLFAGGVDKGAGI